MIKNTALFENEIDTAFSEFSNCGYTELKSNLDKRNIRKMSIGDFKFFLEVFNRNENITKSEKYDFLKNYKYEYEYEGEKYITDFANELVDAICGFTIDKYTCINISNIVNNLSDVGFTSKDFQSNELAEAVTKLINNIFNSEINKRHYNFNSQDISIMLNGLGELGYRKEKLVISEENGNEIPLNIKALAKRIKSQIKNFNSKDIALTLHGLGKIGYNFEDLKESNIIPRLLEKFNSIKKSKTALCYLVLMKGLVATVYGIDQNNLTEEQKQYLNNLKKLISKDVERIVKEAEGKRPDINDETDLYNFDKMLMILENQQVSLKQQELEQEKQQLQPEQQPKQQLRQKEEVKEKEKQQELQKTASTVQTVEEDNKILPKREKRKLPKKIKRQKAQERQLQTKEERRQLKEMKRQRYNEEIEAIRRANNEEKQLHKPEMALRTLYQMIEQYNKGNKTNETENQQKDIKRKQKKEIKKQPEQENQEKPIIKAEQSNQPKTKHNRSSNPGNAIKKKLKRIQKNQQIFEKSEDKYSNKAILAALSGAVTLGTSIAIGIDKMAVLGPIYGVGIK